MGASPESSAAWVVPAQPAAVSQLRHLAASFATAAGAPREVVDAISLAVSETVTNAIIHAYDEPASGEVRVGCRVEGKRFIVEVVDDGRGIAPRRDSPGLGHGLAMVGALVQTLDVARGRDGRGTAVTMAFGPVAPNDAPPGLEVLCALALDTVADVSVIDLLRDGVLRRVAAEVAGDPQLTAWLCAAIPPAKPGTASWTALREGGAHLVVHDPTVARSPGGPGERLDLAWWLAIRLERAESMPSALWGLGGRAGGRPVPSPETIRILADGARANLLAAGERALLRARLQSGRG